MYFWAYLDADGGGEGSNDALTFWSVCDVLNAGHCRLVLPNIGWLHKLLNILGD